MDAPKGEGAAALAAAAVKLAHTLSEVRRRAVQSIDFKLKHGLISVDDLAKDRSVLQGLIGCLAFEDNGTQTDAAVLMLLSKLVAAPFAPKQLLQLGADVQLSSLKQAKPAELNGLFDNVLSALLAAPSHMGSMVTPVGGALVLRSSAAASSMRQLAASSATQAVAYHMHQGALPPPGMTGDNTAPQPTMNSSHPASGTSSFLRSPQRSAAAFTGLQQAAAASFTYSPAPHTHGTAAQHPSRGSYHAPRSPSAPSRVQTSDRPMAGGSSAARPLASAHSVTIDAMSGDARTLLAHKRADRQRQAALLNPESTDSVVSSRDWLLQPVGLGQLDDQELFELGLRLKYVDDPRVVLPALVELHGSALLDLPIEAVAARHDVLNHLLILLTSSSARPDLVSLSAQCLLRMVVQLKRALLLNTDPAYASGPAQAAAAAAAAEEDAAARPLHGEDEPSALGASSGQRCLPQGLPPDEATAGSRSAAAAAAAGILTGSSAEGLPVNVSKIAYLIALQAFEVLKNPQRHFLVAPLVEELLPLLLLGRDGPLLAAGTADTIKWGNLLQVLSQALVTCMSMARAESPPIVQAHLNDGSGPLPPLLSPAVSLLLSLCARVISALPRELWTPTLVPPAISDSLAAVARDDVLCMLLPGLRQAVQPVLAVLRPDVACLLEVAADVEGAVSAAGALVRQRHQQLKLLQQGLLSPQQWLLQLHSALPALHLPGQEGLMEAAIQGLAAACLAAGDRQGGSGGGSADAGTSRPDDWQATAESVFLQLLTHQQPAVAMSCYSLLENMLAEHAGRRAQAHAGQAQLAGQPLHRLLLRKPILEHLVVAGLADERTRRQVARILMQLLADAECHEGILQWACWVRPYEDDPQVGALAASLAAGLRTSLQQWPDASWAKQRALVQELFCRQPERRREAARALADALYFSGTPVPMSEPHSGDPFKVVLDGGARDDLMVPAPNTRVARSFRGQDVDSLLAILANGGLAQELRRSAAEQLTALSGEPRLAEHMASEACLTTIAGVASLREAGGAGLSASQAGALQAQGLEPPSPDLLFNMDMQLPVAAINLLYALAARTPAARAWLLSDGLPALQALVPMVFHNLITVRRAAARLFAGVCFGAEADRWGGWRAAAATRQAADAGGGAAGGTVASGSLLMLPQLLDRVYVFPCRPVWVSVPSPTAHEERQAAVLSGKPRLQDLLAEQRDLVVLLVSERQAIKATRADPLALLRALEQDPGGLGLSAVMVHALAANIRSLAASHQAAACLSAVASAGSHAQCEDALRALQSACGTTWQGAAAFADADWQAPLDRLLTTSPANAEDRGLWLQLLALLRRAIACGSMTQPQYMQLALCFQESMPPLLSAPGAAADPPGLPVALASSPMLPDQSPQHAHLAFLQAALATLTELVRASRLHLPAVQAMRVAASMSLPSMLQLLCDTFLASKEANYGCRVAASQLLLELLVVLRGAHAAGEQGLLQDSLDEPLLACLSALLTHACPSRTAAAAAASGSSSAPPSQPLPRPSQRQGGFSGSALQRLAMHCTLQLTTLLPCRAWSPAWQRASGTFWLSRLLRDRDATLRALAVELLGRLVQPGADETHAMVLQSWPDAQRAMLQLALDRSNCYALRGGALRLLSCCLAHAGVDAEAPRSGQPPASAGQLDDDATQRTDGLRAAPLPSPAFHNDATGSDDTNDLIHATLAPSAMSTPEPRRLLFSSGTLPASALLLHSGSELWERLPALLREPDAPPAFLSAALALALQGLVLMPERAVSLLRTPGLLGRLLQLLELQPLQVQAGSESEQRRRVMGLVGRSMAGAAAAGCEGAAAAMLELAVGLNSELQLQAGEDPGAAETLRVTPLVHCMAGLVAQLLALTQSNSERPLLHLHALGHPAPGVAAALLRVFVRLSRDVATLDVEWELHSGPLAQAHAAQLQALHQAAVACNTLLQQLSAQEAHEVLAALNDTICKQPGALLALCCEALLARCCGRQLKVAVVCLTATLLAHGPTAARLLRFEGSDDEFIVASAGKDVGAALCNALTVMLPDDALAVASRDAGSGYSGGSYSYGDGCSGGGSGVLMLGADDLCVVVALRNLLTHSASGKIAALKARLHAALMQCCGAVAAALAALSAAQGDRRGGGQQAGGTPTKPSRAARSGIPSAGGAAGGVAPAQGGPGAAAARSKWGLRRGPVQAGPSSAGGAAPDSTPVSSAPAGLHSQRQAKPGAPLAGGPTQQQQQHATRQALEQKAVVALSLLKHLAYRSGGAKQLLVRDGLLAALRALWLQAAAATSGPLFHELLGCITNLLTDCADARARFVMEGATPAEAQAARGGGGDGSGGGGGHASAGGGSLLNCLMTTLFQGPRLEQSTFRLAVGVLLHLSAAEDGAALLLRSQHFLPACHKALQDMASGGGSGGMPRAAPAAARPLGRDLQRQASLMQVLTNLAATPEGQRILLRGTSTPALLELVVRLVAPELADADSAATFGGGSSGAAAAGAPLPAQQLQLQAALRVAALGLLRNLCFAPEAKSHLLAHPAVLPALVGAVEGVADSPQGAAYAASGLWAMVYQGEKVKSALRRVPSAMQRLVASQAACQFQLRRVSQQVQQAEANNAGGDEPRPPPKQQALQLLAAQHGGHAHAAQGQGLAALRERLQWLKHAQVQLDGLVETMDATAPGQAGGAGERGGPGHVGARPAPDRSPARDQDVGWPQVLHVHL